MTGKTHIMGGIAAAMAVVHTTDYDPAIFIAAGALGSIIPDICHTGSKIGRMLPHLSKWVNKIFGHRTFTHSLLFLIMMNAIIDFFIPFENVRMGILIGMVSHLLLDALTKNGIKLLYPLNIKIRFPFTMKTGGAIESVVFAALSMLVLYYGKDVLIHYL